MMLPVKGLKRKTGNSVLYIAVYLQLTFWPWIVVPSWHNNYDIWHNAICDTFFLTGMRFHKTLSGIEMSLMWHCILNFVHLVVTLCTVQMVHKCPQHHWCTTHDIPAATKARFTLAELMGHVNSASGNARPSTPPVLTGNGNRSPVNSGR